MLLWLQWYRVSIRTINISETKDIKSAVQTQGIQKGDLMYFSDEGGNVNHATIISRVDDEMIYYSGNTKRRYDQSLEESIDENGVRIIKMNNVLPSGGENNE